MHSSLGLCPHHSDANEGLSDFQLSDPSLRADWLFHLITALNSVFSFSRSI